MAKSHARKIEKGTLLVSYKTYAETLIKKGMPRREVAQSLAAHFGTTFPYMQVMVYRWFGGAKYAVAKKHKGTGELNSMKDRAKAKISNAKKKAIKTLEKQASAKKTDKKAVPVEKKVVKTATEKRATAKAVAKKNTGATFFDQDML